MAKQPDPEASKSGGTNPSTTSRDGGINPSAPTSGTEGWGTTTDERQTLDLTDSAATRAGQMKGNLGDQQTSASRRSSAAAGSANRPAGAERDQAPLGDNQAEETTKGAPAFSMNTSHGGADRTFRCADMGNADCRWETAGLTDDEVITAAYEHGRTEHDWQDWTDAMRSKVKNAIRYRNAA